MVITIVLCVILCAIFSLIYLFYFNIGPISTNTIFSDDETDSLPYIIPEKKEKSSFVATLKPTAKDSTSNLLYKSKETDCKIYHEIYDSEQFPNSNCCGYGSCVIMCPQHAISISDGMAVISQFCNGCVKCVSVCPRIIIVIVPSDSEANMI